MGISIFEIIGPVMIGPSSSHTAGMARIGSMAHRIAGGKARSIRVFLSHNVKDSYKGHGSDAALIGGALGLREDDVQIRDALRLAEEAGIRTAVDFFPPGEEHPNAARVDVTLENGEMHSVQGISVGGGSLVIEAVDGMRLSLKPECFHLLCWGLAPEVLSALPHTGDVQGTEKLCAISFDRCPEAELYQALPCEKRLLPPVLPYGATRPEAPHYTSCQEAAAAAREQNISLSELAIRYECARSGFEREAVLSRMQLHLDKMKRAVADGFSGKFKMLYGITGGKDAAMMQKAAEEGRCISGGLVPFAVAKALAVMEYNAAMGCVVAAPTAGSAGIVPGCMLQVQEAFGLSDADLIRGLFVSGLVGVIMAAREVSFSGSVGGCQGEVGVSSAIAAAGLASLFTDDPEAVFHAMAMCMKNLLGLVCDPIADPIEVPCIKRNTVGVANAFASADMALAGIRSYIPPDEVIEALIDVEKRLPRELKAGGCGALVCTGTAACLRESLRKKK